LAAATVVFAVMWIGANNQKTVLNKQNDSIRTSFEEATKTINEIQGNLDTIESGITGNLISGKELPGEDRKTTLMNTINGMKKQIETDKKRIADLEAMLAKSKTQIKGIQEMVEKLKASLADKEKIVAELSDQLGIVTTTLETERTLSKEEIAKRDKDIADKQVLLEAQEKDINTMFYAFGTRKDLIVKKIISRQGGLLGIGKVSTLQKNTDLERFQTFSLQQSESISFPLTKKGYSILTNQNSSSYKVERDGQSYILKVLDKSLFRKNKVLVIEIL
jgi:predicted RNase H-like nuclease (RuvC/YqgF family)